VDTREFRIECNRLLELVDRFGQKARFAIGTTDEHAQRRTIAEMSGHTLV